ncbi:MAG: hypothetical protein AB1510_01845, partial [Bacillota bacterium]
MKSVKKLFRLRKKKNIDYAGVKLTPLIMEVRKDYSGDTPHEITIVIPRLELKEKLHTPLFSKIREIVFNSITIVVAPRAPLAGKEGEKTPASPG